jgi:antitoxin MazE
MFGNGRRPVTVTLRRVAGGLEIVIPDELAVQAGLSEGTPVTVNVEHGRVIAESAAPTPPRYSLEQLVAGITPDNVHGETDWGAPVGNEAW